MPLDQPRWARLVGNSRIHSLMVVAVPVIALVLDLTGVVNTNPAQMYSGLAIRVAKSILPGLPSLDLDVG